MPRWMPQGRQQEMIEIEKRSPVPAFSPARQACCCKKVASCTAARAVPAKQRAVYFCHAPLLFQSACARVRLAAAQAFSTSSAQPNAASVSAVRMHVPNRLPTKYTALQLPMGKQPTVYEMLSACFHRGELLEEVSLRQQQVKAEITPTVPKCLEGISTLPKCLPNVCHSIKRPRSCFFLLLREMFFEEDAQRSS